jgi:U3 small nucleolar RNA-associated protein 3
VAAAERAKERRAARKRELGPERYAAEPIVAPGLEEVEEDGKREISGKIAANRGLTPHRNKDYKNPRKKHRIKFDKAVIRRKGAIREVQPGAAGGYGGELSGIKSSISRSRRF